MGSCEGAEPISRDELHLCAECETLHHSWGVEIGKGAVFMIAKAGLIKGKIITYLNPMFIFR